jgi:hypothetical protein
MYINTELSIYLCMNLFPKISYFSLTKKREFDSMTNNGDG